MNSGIYYNVEAMSKETKLSKFIILQRIKDGEIPGCLKIKRTGFVSFWLLPQEARFQLHEKVRGRKPAPPRKLNHLPLFDKPKKEK